MGDGGAFSRGPRSAAGAARTASRSLALSVSAHVGALAMSRVLMLPVLLVQVGRVAALGRPRVVFTDCDGTMLRSDHSLSERARRTLRRLDEAGVIVVPATGRARAGTWTESVLTEPALRGGLPGIYCNGCTSFDRDGTALPPALLPQDLPGRVLAVLDQTRVGMRCVPVAYVGSEALYADSSSALIPRLAGVGDSPLRLVSCLRSTCATSPVSKMLLLYDSAAISALRAEVEPVVGYDSGGALTQAINWMLEVVPSHADKGVAASALLKRWGLGWEEALAIGDGENDLPMLARAGTSVAMGNAGERVRHAAMHVVGHNDEDGWAEAMERFVLNVS
eukprot:scaffold157229_cov31-Tisochrysis_lutea.AAC.1